MFKNVVVALSFAALVACGASGTGPSAIPSPSPSPIVAPTPPPINISISIDIIDASSRHLIFSADHGQEVVFKSSVQAFNPATNETVPAPFIVEHAWQNFSDPNVGAVLFGPVTTDHPHGIARGDGFFIVRDTAFTYDNVVVGRSPLYSLPIGTAAAMNTWRRLSDEESAMVLAEFEEVKRATEGLGSIDFPIYRDEY